MKAERIGFFTATVLSAIAMDGEPAQQPQSGWEMLRDMPTLVKPPPDVTFLGEQNPDLIRSFVFAEEVADEYWEGLGYEGYDCEGELEVTFTDEFADEPDYDPDSEPAGAVDPDTCQEWLNSDFEGDPWGMALTHTHERGHLQGIHHSADERSVMYSDDRRDAGQGEDSPEDATTERFEGMFDVEFEDR